MTDTQLVTAVAAERGRPAPPDGATFRQLLSGTVFGPGTAEGTDGRPGDAREDDRRTTAHCRHAMHYVD
ncbi:hypothetical protein [Kitasatospora sp. NRRL B-11411]|uniref:hypothetical protein n=1 Tax=Kitasatospora sp. NRRL B-11411 TaxID=1463822 RepID=UPI0004C3D10C|nr:hypothetical protein [Kitasatospora sp. NRRL B-11411]